jgi:thiol-disulfide isomerase/thioredoxin
MRTLLLLSPLLILVSCAARGPAQASSHGQMSSLSAAATADFEGCEHRVPREVCTRCDPSREAAFKAVGDWCPEHAVPESQCHLCHPNLTFAPLPAVPEGADYAVLGQGGADVGPLEPLAVPGKVTVFDFYAAWCAPCREVEAHLLRALQGHGALAVRKLDVVNWESPLARRHLAGVESLPYVVVYGRDGRRVDAVSGLDLPRLDRAIAAGAEAGAGQ